MQHKPRLALIPARSGSKRIPGKNTKLFCGQPLIAYSIQVAQASGLFDEIVVSTDCQEIALLSRSLGAKVPFMRPAELSDDFTGTREVISHAITSLQAQNRHFEYCCCIYATAPFLQAEFLQKGLELLESNPDKAFAFSVTSFGFPVQRGIKLDNGKIKPMFPEHVLTRSQDLEACFHDAGQFYWGRTRDYLKPNKTWFSEHSLAVQIPRYLVQDIDTPEDWQRAELMYKAYTKG